MSLVVGMLTSSWFAPSLCADLTGSGGPYAQYTTTTGTKKPARSGQETSGEREEEWVKFGSVD